MDGNGDGWDAAPRPGQSYPWRPLQEVDSRSPKWSDRFNVRIKPECGGLCVMKCNWCKANLSPADASTTMQRHNCTRQALEAAGVRISPRKTPVLPCSSTICVYVGSHPL